MSSSQTKFSSSKQNSNIELLDDFSLLDSMMHDSKRQTSAYQPGPYWASKAQNAVNEIKRCGIKDFRGATNCIGLSYSDNLFIDVRNEYNHGIKSLASLFTKIYPFNKIYDAQVRMTESYANQCIIYAQEILNLNDKPKYLLKKYNVPYSILGNCLNKVKIEDNYHSIHYLNLLEQHDNIAKFIDFKNAFSVFEIGGGFGINIHLLLENYKNIKKVLYLDIPPNLYVGTQYLKAFFGDCVYDYNALKNQDSIKFSKENKLEVFCIAPWQIEKFADSIDIFMNSHSFVEMPKNIIKNYVEKIMAFPNSSKCSIALTTYDNFDTGTTIHPNELPTFFKDRNFNYFEEHTLLDSTRKNLYFVSIGKTT
ncbi:MAG: putative sugar O-methyltransferase [Bacteroidales bacterium]|nr:putative sugar O-methyltransferase [Bacteroidales bacterium]